jgi:hypothetical protein
MLDGAGQGGYGMAWLWAGITLSIWNCVIWGFGTSGFIVFGVDLANDNYENIDIYDSTVGLIGSNQIFTVANMACFDNGVDFQTIGGATGTNCLSVDATAANPNWAVGVGNLINQVTANCVQGVNPAVANFMDILAGGTLDGAGVANVLARPTCIRNRAVPGPNGTSIGAAEIPPVAPTPTPVTVAEAERLLGAMNANTRQYWNRMDGHMMGI